MNKPTALCLLAFGWPAAIAAADPALTIYNENFAVVRDTVPLDLKAGTTEVRFADVTAHLEPSSVILRDASGKVPLRVVEQNYDFEAVSQALLLSRFEGKTIGFRTANTDGKPGEIVQGKIIRGGYVVRSPDDNRSSNSDAGEAGSSEGPIVEVDGKLSFSLPGEPMFPALGDDTLLKPALDWKIYSRDAAKLDAELAYVTSDMDWHADYSVVSPEKSDTLELIGLVTITNGSGKAFKDARIKLMAGNVNKVADENSGRNAIDRLVVTGSMSTTTVEGPPAVTVKSFDEYHLYSLPLPTSLRNHETKQVEFTRSEAVKSKTIYVYDGYRPDPDHYNGEGMEQIRETPDYGTLSVTKVHVLREFKNSEANGLGIALPKGRLRFYRRDDDGQLEFTGENTIDHTPKDETLSIYSGDAFDLVGARTRTGFKTDEEARHTDETFEIKVRNHKAEPVEIRVVEHLYRWTNWTLVKPAVPWTKLDAQTMETQVALKPDEEKTVGYTVHYSW